MADKSAIEWTEATWNPTTGCDRVSPGCDNCYALTLAPRLKAMGSKRYQRDGDPRTSGPGFALTLHEDTLDLPLRWKRPRRRGGSAVSEYVWLYTGAGKRTHAVPAPGRSRAMAVCGTSPHWINPVGWLGMDRAGRADAARLDHCGRCTRVLARGTR
jgi:phage protein Gp37/Gp68